MKTLIIAIFLAAMSFCCQASQLDDNVMIESYQLLDQSRQRPIPCVLYKSQAAKDDVPVVIISHGYGVKNTEYTFIAEPLTAKGYFVVSIQHDLANDPELPKVENLFERRLPLWERGVQNILFVLSDLERRYPHLNTDKVILIGHSNGGDISMLLATKHSERISKVVSLDSLRYPFPTRNPIPVLSLRGNDTKADEGVLPDNGVTLIQMADAKHIDLCDRGPVRVKEKMIEQITRFLDGVL